MNAAIFDMDGTLLDSMAMWLRLPSLLLEQKQLALAAEQQRMIRGYSLHQACSYLLAAFPHTFAEDSSEALAEHCMLLAQQCYRQEVLPKPGVIAYLERLQRSGVAMAVATLTPHPLVEDALAQHDLLRFFDVVLTPQDVGGDHKDRPTIFLESARRLGHPIAETVVFEDSYFAAETAKAAGFAVWGVADRNQSAREQIALRAVADRFLEGFEEIC